jgi:hypothetical protein
MPSNRFKAATSFECDGCSHHASFHSLENPAEDAVIRKWTEQTSDVSANSLSERRITTAPRNKRKRLTERSHDTRLQQATTTTQDLPGEAESHLDSSGTLDLT